MGKYAQLANAADCKSATLAVNIAGSIPALPTSREPLRAFHVDARRLAHFVCKCYSAFAYGGLFTSNIFMVVVV